MLTRREKVRQLAFDEIKAFSWEIVSQGGIDALTVHAIAKKMGMTPPAFYRYYKNRDALIKSLVLDAYASFQTALETARDHAPADAIPEKLYRVFMAYRKWAVSNASMFGLFAGKKVYGFDNNDPDIMCASEKIYHIFSELYFEAWKKGFLKVPEKNMPMPPSYLDHIQGFLTGRFEEAPAVVMDLILNSACLVHGMISMELSDRLAGLCGDPETFYRYQILGMFQRMGMDYTRFQHSR